MYAVVDSRGVCPVNWHVPSSAEFATLNSFIGSDGGSLKEAGLTHWNSPNTGASNKYNFTALATGYMGTLSPSGLGNVTYFWTVTSNTTDNSRAFTRSLSKDNALFVESISLNVLEMACLGIRSIVTATGTGTWPELAKLGIVIETDWSNIPKTASLIADLPPYLGEDSAQAARKFIDIRNNLSALLDVDLAELP